MKTGKTLTELAMEIERQKIAKQDFIVPTPQMFMKAPKESAPVLELRNHEIDDFSIRHTAHRQIGERSGVPAKYYDRMLEDAPGLLAFNVNHWWRSEPCSRMLRTIHGEARALLSDRYHRIENEHIAEAVLPILGDHPGLRIESCEITERRMYIKAVNTRVQEDVAVGDTVQAGVLITNSEIGYGALTVTPLIFRLVCLNGMVVNDGSGSFRRMHIGGQADQSDEVYAMLQDDTLKADDKAIMLKARDVVRGALDHAIFGDTVQNMRDAKEGKQIDDPVKGAERLAKAVGLTEGEQNSVLTHLIQGGDLSRYGTLNAVTRAAQDVESYDRSTELEQVGGRILTLKSSEWTKIAEAA